MTNITTMTLPYVFQLFDFFHVIHGFIAFFGGSRGDFCAYNIFIERMY